MSTHKLGSTAPVAGHWPRIESCNCAESRRRGSIPKRQVLAAIFIAAALALPLVMIAYPTGAPAGYTGAPASSVDSGGDCTSCHGGTAQTTGLSISGFGSGNTYTPGAVEHLTVTLPVSTSRHGFEFTARSASSTATGEGTLASTDSNTQVLSGGLFITHTNASSVNTFNFDWTPPATNVGTIIFYAAGVNGYSNVIKTNVTLTPSGGGGAPPPTLGVSPTSLSFAYQIGGATPAAQSLSITSSGAALSFTATTSGGSWLSASPASGATPGSVSVSVNPAGLAAGTYNGSVAIAASGAGNSPQTVAVTFTVTLAAVPNLTVSPTSLSFTAQAGGAAPAAQSISVGSSGAALNFTAAASGGTWLAATPSSGATPGTVSVSANPAGLAAGTYNGSVAIASSGAGNSPQTVAVTLTVTAAPPPRGSGLTVTPTSMSFTSTVSGANPAPQTLNVAAASSTRFRASVSGTSGGVTWLSISPSGRLTTNQNLTVTVTAVGLAVGTYNGSIALRVSTGEELYTTTTVPVTLVVAPLTISPNSLSFSGTVGGAAPTPQTIAVTGPTAASFTASASVQNGTSNWLSILPSGSLTSNQNINVSVTSRGLSAGTYNGTISIVSGLGTSTLAVTFVVNPSGGGGGNSTGYKLIGWNDLGMHCFDGADYSVFGVLPPYNTIHAHLIDPSGTLVRTPAGYTITYQAINDPLTNTLNTTSIGKTNFWQFAQALGFPGLTPNVGLKGYAMPGANNTPQGMNFSTTDSTWIAEGIPITPFVDSSINTYQRNYFPMMRLSVKNSSGIVVGTTDIVVPTSDEMTCAMCHGSGSGYAAAQPASGWVNNPDPAKDTKLNILRKHDDRFAALPVFQTAAQLVGYSTSGLEATVANKPVYCSNCHASNALSKPGVPGLPALTTAMHTSHFGVIDPRTGQTMDSGTTRDTCYTCHPGPKTQCTRGVMANNGMECQNCHGPMSNVAAPTRKGWMDLPNCQSCHTGTATSNAGQIVYTSVFSSGTTVRTVTDTTFATNPDTPSTGVSLYRYSSGHGGLQCEACHGSTHAEYETSVVNDNVQSNNIQGHVGMLAECTACHASTPNTTNGGPHGLHPIGSSWVGSHPSAARGNQAACQPCHGTDYRGTILSRTKADRTLAGNSFPRGTIIGCYSCHNGPNGGDD